MPIVRIQRKAGRLKFGAWIDTHSNIKIGRFDSLECVSLSRPLRCDPRSRFIRLCSSRLVIVHCSASNLQAVWHTTFGMIAEQCTIQCTIQCTMLLSWALFGLVLGRCMPYRMQVVGRTMHDFGEMVHCSERIPSQYSEPVDPGKYCFWRLPRNSSDARRHPRRMHAVHCALAHHGFLLPRSLWSFSASRASIGASWRGFSQDNCWRERLASVENGHADPPRAAESTIWKRSTHRGPPTRVQSYIDIMATLRKTLTFWRWNCPDLFGSATSSASAP